MAPKVSKSALTTNGKQNQSMSKGELKCKSSYYDKKSGTDSRVTTKESVSSGDYTSRGRAGKKDEYTTNTTVRVGSDKGYTEYSNQEKFTKVYGAGYNSNYGCGKKTCSDVGYSTDGTCHDGSYDHDSDVNFDDDDDDSGQDDDQFDSYDDGSDVNGADSCDDDDATCAQDDASVDDDDYYDDDGNDGFDYDDDSYYSDDYDDGDDDFYYSD